MALMEWLEQINFYCVIINNKTNNYKFRLLEIKTIPLLFLVKINVSAMRIFISKYYKLQK